MRTLVGDGFAGQVQDGESHGEDADFETSGPAMEFVELDAARIVLRDVVDNADVGSDGEHFSSDNEDGDQREHEHDHNEYVTRGEGVRETGVEARIPDGSDEEDDAGDDAHPVKRAERAADDFSGEVVSGKDAEHGGGDYGGEENDAADPDDER